MAEDRGSDYYYDRDADTRPEAGSHAGLMISLCSAAAELGLRMGAFSFVCRQFPRGKDAMLTLPSWATPETGSAPDNGAPRVHVRLGGGDLDKIRSDMIDAVVSAAAHPWYRTGKVHFVYEPLIGLWPSLRERGPRVVGLAERLHRVVAPAAGDEVQWFYAAAEQATVEAYLAGAPVAVMGTLFLECGSYAFMHVHGPNRPKPTTVSISVEGDSYDEVIDRGVELVLRGHAIPPTSSDYHEKARYLRAAMVASTVELPDSVEALTE